MKLSRILLVATLFFALTAVGKGHAKHKAKPSKNSLTLVEAYTQRTLPGVPRGPISTATHLVVIWQGSSYPESFFWRGDNGFLPCNIEKAYKVNRNSQSKMPPGLDYQTEVINAGKIHKGDTLMLSPVTGGKFAVPKEIPESAKNTLYYKTGGSGWVAFPVKTMGKKHDIAMP